MKKMMILLALGLTLGLSGVASAHSDNPCNPCAMKDKMMKHNPCEMKKHKMMKKHNPCSMNPCEMKKHKKW